VFVFVFFFFLFVFFFFRPVRTRLCTASLPAPLGHTLRLFPPGFDPLPCMGSVRGVSQDPLLSAFQSTGVTLPMPSFPRPSGTGSFFFCRRAGFRRCSYAFHHPCPFMQGTFLSDTVAQTRRHSPPITSDHVFPPLFPMPGERLPPQISPAVTFFFFLTWDFRPFFRLKPEPLPFLRT